MKYKIFQDWSRNKGYFKGQFILASFRFAHLVKSSLVLKALFFWYLLFYRFFIEWGLGIEISWNLTAGKGFRLYHGVGLVINGNSVIGDNCTLRHTTTIGNKRVEDNGPNSCPIIGNNVDIGAHVCILGNIVIGDNVVIGAGSIITKSIPANCIVVGNPAKIIKQF